VRKVIFIFFTICFLYPCFCLNIPQAKNSPSPNSCCDWETLKKTWENYCDNPSSKNAYRVYMVLPKKQPKDATRHTHKIGGNVKKLMLETLSILEKEIYASDRNSVKIAFRLFTISDGLLTEDLCIILGHFICINPKMFLEELKEHRHLVSFIMDSLLGNLGEEYVDKMEASYLEMIRRIKCIEGVKDNSLLQMKDECLKELNKAKKELEAIVQEKRGRCA